MNSFATTFRRIVVPDLARAIDLLVHSSTLLDLSGGGGMDFHDIRGAVVRQARKRGAFYMPDDRQDELLDWIGATILEAQARHLHTPLAQAA